jgi:D-alanyl-D-alanine carboxypeptidase
VSNLGIPADYGRLRGLPRHAEAKKLVSLGPNADGRDIKVTPEAAVAWGQLRAAAAVAGITLVAVSGFRSIARQSEIIQAKLDRGDKMDAILQVMAAPGFSEHHTGRAIDITVPGEMPLVEEFTLTPAFAWLEAHAGEFGFRLSYPRDNPYGIAYEPWHWFYIGPA